MAKAKKKGQTPPRTARLEAKGRPVRAPALPDKHRAKRRANIITAVIVFLLIGGVVTAVVLTQLASDAPEGAPEGVRTFEVQEAQHVPGPVEYEQTPPVGGNHAEVWQNCGFYGSPIASENAVHSLEHGAVWITYQPGLAADDLRRVRELAQGRTYVIASEFPDLPSPVVASAWGVQLQFDSADDPRLEQFVEFYRQGPQTPERGAACTNGVGEPE